MLGKRGRNREEVKEKRALSQAGQQEGQRSWVSMNSGILYFPPQAKVRRCLGEPSLCVCRKHSLAWSKIPKAGASEWKEQQAGDCRAGGLVCLAEAISPDIAATVQGVRAKAF